MSGVVFLRTTGGELINANAIERVEEGERKGLRWQARATLADGRTVTLGDDINEVEVALLPVVAAAPGFTRLRYYKNGGNDQPWVERMPVVAWRINGGDALPITPDQGEDAVLVSGVLLPDSQVVMPGLWTYPDEAAWRAAMDEQAKDQRKLEREGTRKPKTKAETAP